MNLYYILTELLTLFSLIHYNDGTLVFDYNYKSCTLSKITVVEKKKHKIEVWQEFQFQDKLYKGSFSHNESLFYKMCGKFDKQISACPKNSVACLFNKKNRKTINFGTEFYFDNTTEHRITTVNGEKCTESERYSLTVILHCPSVFENKQPMLTQTENCHYEITILDPNCNIPCSLNIEGQFLDLSPLKRSYCIEPEQNNTYCVSLCDIDQNCVQRSKSRRLNNSDLNACEYSNEGIQPIALASTLKAYYNGEKNTLVFHGSLHQNGLTKIINILQVNLRCNWNKQISDSKDLRYIKKIKQGKNYDFELESIYGCIIKPISCLFTENNLIYNLNGLYSSHREKWKVGNISNEMFLNICGPLELPAEYEGCRATYSQVCEHVDGKHVNRGAVLRHLDIKNDIIYGKIENGTQCEDTQFATLIEFHCAEREEGPHFIKSKNCITYILWRTPYACPKFNESNCDKPVSIFSCNFSQNGSYFDFEPIKEQKVILNGTNEFYISICGAVTIKDAPCMKNTIALLNRTEFNMKYRVLSLGKFPEARIEGEHLTLKYTGGQYCDEGKDYTTTVRFLCSELEEGPYLINETKCSFEFEWKTPHGCFKNKHPIIPTQNCVFKDLVNNRSFDFNGIQTQLRVKNVNLTYTFDICQNNYTICDAEKACSSELLKISPSLVTNENATSVQMHLPKSCVNTEDFNTVSFELTCDRIQNNEHIKSYFKNGCVLDVKYAVNSVCSEEESQPKVNGLDLGGDSLPKTSNNAVKISLGVTGGILILLVVSVLCYLFLKKRMQYKSISNSQIYVKVT